MTTSFDKEFSARKCAVIAKFQARIRDFNEAWFKSIARYFETLNSCGSQGNAENLAAPLVGD
jgi:hypothetical protein